MIPIIIGANAVMPAGDIAAAIPDIIAAAAYRGPKESPAQRVLPEQTESPAQQALPERPVRFRGRQALRV